MLGGILNIVMWVGAALLFGGFVFLVMWFRSFSKIRAEITDLTNNGRKTYTDKVRAVKDKKGRSGWQFLKTKSLVGAKSKVISEPPYKFVDLLDNGVKFVRFVKIGDEIHPWHPDFSVDVSESSDGEVKTVFKGVKTEALSTNEREAYLYEMQRSETYGSRGWKDLLSSAMPFITILIVILGGVIMYDTVSSNILEQQQLVDDALSRSERTNSRVAESLERVAEILSGGEFVNNPSSSGVEVPN